MVEDTEIFQGIVRKLESESQLLTVFDTMMGEMRRTGQGFLRVRVDADGLILFDAIQGRDALDADPC